jgi:hypothetical protein
MPDKNVWDSIAIHDHKGKPTAMITISQDNYQDLSDLMLFLKGKGATAVRFSQVPVSALSQENYDRLVQTENLLPHLIKALKTAKKEKIAYSLEGLPLCLLPGEEDHFVLTNEGGIKMQFCLNCELSPRCGGITKAQLIAQYGTQLLSWQFLFPKDFFSDADIAFLDEQLLKESTKG